MSVRALVRNHHSLIFDLDLEVWGRRVYSPTSRTPARHRVDPTSPARRSSTNRTERISSAPSAGLRGSSRATSLLAISRCECLARAEGRATHAIAGADPIRVPRDGPMQLILDAATAKEACPRSAAGEVDLRTFARALGQLGHYVWLRSCVPSNSKKEGLRLKHSFLVCGTGGRAALAPARPRPPPPPAAGAPSAAPPAVALIIPRAGAGLVVIDPHFREQFLVANASETYAQLCSYLPPVFAGSASDVANIVGLMCREVAAMFAQQGRTCPPWREHKAMVTKWLPSKAVDEEVEA
jgi:hypothetical protein